MKIRIAATRRIGLVAAAAATAAATALGAVPAAHAATGTLSLLILPDQGETQIYNFVNSAKSSIDMTMYELRDTTMENDLIAREKAGVNVRVILDGKETSVNSAAYSALQAGGVSVTYSSTSFTYTHQKTVTVDNAESYISTGNLDTTYYSTSRDYGVFDTDLNDVNAIVAVFNADFAKTAITPGDGDDLVWSPTDSQSHLLAVINGAQHTLDIQQEEFSDSALLSAIVAASNRGVTVRAVIENENNEWASGISEVEAAGAQGHHLHLVDRVLRPRQDDHRRLRHVDGEGVPRLGEHDRQLAQRQPRARSDHHRRRRAERSGDHVRHRLRLRLRLDGRGHRDQPGQPVGRRRHRRQPADLRQ